MPTTPQPANTSYEPKIGYIVSRFPMISETFIVHEMDAMEKLGVPIELFVLLRERPKVVHPEAGKWVSRAHYHASLSRAVLQSQWHFIRRNPMLYLRTWTQVLRGTWGCLRCFGGALVFFPKAVRFAYEMTNLGIKHVHAHFAYHPAVAALIVHRLTGIPFSLTAHGSDIQADGHMLREKVEAAEFAVAVSAYNKQIMLRKCGPEVAEKIHIIHGGVDVDRLSPRAASGRKGPFRILCVARFEEVKGHAYLVEACRLLRERGIDVECRLVGGGLLLPRIEKQIKNADLGERVQLLGERSYQEVVQEFLLADVLVLPTAPTASGKCEGSPTVLKEAMACGLPVVSSLVGGISELVDDKCTGILVRPRDAAALADALQQLHGDAFLRCQLGRAGRERVVREFDLQASTARLARLFLEATGIEARPGRQVIDRPATRIAHLTTPSTVSAGGGTSTRGE
jgi:colanic acid/amylovoran biosynthesis glycosyltransferase